LSQRLQTGLRGGTDFAKGTGSLMPGITLETFSFALLGLQFSANLITSPAQTTARLDRDSDNHYPTAVCQATKVKNR